MRAAFMGLSLMFVLAGPVQAAETPAEIVDKAIKAVGGEAKLAKYGAEQWKAKGTMEAMGMKMAYTADYFYQRPGMLRFDVAMELGGMKIVLTAATDGKVAWEKMGDMLREMETKKSKAFHDNVHTISLCQLLPLKQCTLALADEIKVDGKDAVGIKASKKGQRDVTLYFDKKTYLLLKSVSSVWDEFTDKDVVQENYMVGWKEKDGVWHFDKLVIQRGGKDFIVEEMSDQKAMEKHDAKLFAKP